MKTNKLSEFTTSELIQELHNRNDVWAVKVWLRSDIESWLNENLQFYTNDKEDLEDHYDEIVDDAIKSTANLDDACETDWATIEYYMSDLLRTNFGASPDVAR